MRNIVGRIITSEHDFFGRDKEISQLWSDLESNNLLLLAPRRVGKSSVLYRLREDATAQGYSLAVYVSVEDAETEHDFVSAIGRAVAEALEQGSKSGRRKWKKSATATLKRVTSIKLGYVAVELGQQVSDWRQVGDELMASLEGLDGRLLIMLDELPVFVLKLLDDGADDQSSRSARAFLGWFRRVRQGRAENIRWIVAGSIGLDTVAHRFSLGQTINDFKLFAGLGALGQDEADLMLETLCVAYGLTIDTAARQAVLKRIGWPIPFHVQLVFSELRKLGQGRTIDARAIDAAFEVLLSREGRAYFDGWYQRLTDELGKPLDGYARLVATACAADPKGATRSTLFQALSQKISDPMQCDSQLDWILDVLESDGYLVSVGGRLAFRSPLLREFWNRWYGP